MHRTTKTPSLSLLLLFFSLLLLTNPLPSSSFSLFIPQKLQTLFSLSHSLFTRVANLREARGDYVGAGRARSIARNIERGLGFGFWKVLWSVGWDYARNFGWRGGATTTSFDVFGAVSELKEFLSALGELARVNSVSERVDWVNRNYGNLLRLSRSIFDRLLKAIRQPGPLKEMVETLKKEVVEGGLLKDCLELGSDDLKGLIVVLKDLASNFASTSSNRADL